VEVGGQVAVGTAKSVPGRRPNAEQRAAKQQEKRNVSRKELERGKVCACAEEKEHDVQGGLHQYVLITRSLL
jgi:hypothetical protein